MWCLDSCRRGKFGHNTNVTYIDVGLLITTFDRNFSWKYNHEMKISIGKIESARRQLETAIVLYFNERDILSIHTLMGASSRIIKDLLKSKLGEQSYLERKFEGILDAGNMKILRDSYNSDQNFLKHADKDPDGNILFNTFKSEIQLYMTIQDYYRLTKEKSDLMSAYEVWLMMNNRETFKIDRELPDMKFRSRMQFLSEYLPFLQNLVLPS